MPGLDPEILDTLYSAAAVAWPVLCLLAGVLVVRLRCERMRRAAVEQELRESESRYRAIFETAVDAIIVSDQHGIIREFSKAAEAMTGYRAAELIGQNMRVLLPPTMRREPPYRTLPVDGQGTRGLPQGRVRFPGTSVDCRMVGRRPPAFHRHLARPLCAPPGAARADQAGGAAPSGAKNGGDR